MDDKRFLPVYGAHLSKRQEPMWTEETLVASPSRGQPADAGPDGVGGGWLFLSPDAVPGPWRERGVPAVFVPLTPDEARELLASGSAEPDLDRDDVELLRLLTRGLSTRELAERLYITPRTVQRRLRSLQTRLGARSKDELALLAARRGF